jgi:hypothetical protein
MVKNKLGGGKNYKKTRNYLHYKLKYKISQSNAIIRRYGASIGHPYKLPVTDAYYESMGVIIQDDWQKFMEFFGSIKHEYKKFASIRQSLKYKGKRDSYQEWYDEASMDGSLAYNNSSDDF